MRIFLTSMVLILASNAVQAQTPNCADLAPSNLTTAKFVAVATASKKSEYETSLEVEERLTKLLPDKNVVGIQKDNPFWFLQYNADAEVLRLDVQDVGGLFNGIYVGKLTSRMYWGVKLSRTTKKTGSYVGQNGFGAKATVEEKLSEEIGLVSADVAFGPPTPIDLHIPRNLAAQVKSRLQIQVTGVLIEPYFIEDTSLSEATIKEPVDMTTRKAALVIQPKCVAVFDPVTKVVYGSWVPTAKP